MRIPKPIQGLIPSTEKSGFTRCSSLSSGWLGTHTDASVSPQQPFRRNQRLQRKSLVRIAGGMIEQCLLARSAPGHLHIETDCDSSILHNSARLYKQVLGHHSSRKYVLQSSQIRCCKIKAITAANAGHRLCANMMERSWAFCFVRTRWWSLMVMPVPAMAFQIYTRQAFVRMSFVYRGPLDPSVQNFIGQVESAFMAERRYTWCLKVCRSSIGR